MAPNERALSDIIAQLLIVFLVVLVTLLIIASLTGVLTKMLQKPAFIVVTASPHNTSTGQVIVLYDKQGDLVNLNGTSQTAGSSEIAISLTKSPGSPVFVHNVTAMHARAWGPGQYLYIYPTAGSYGYTDTASSAAPDLPAGNYTIQIIDTRAQVLLHTLPVKID